MAGFGIIDVELSVFDNRNFLRGIILSRLLLIFQETVYFEKLVIFCEFSGNLI
jgi:hypothetical protein